MYRLLIVDDDRLIRQNIIDLVNWQEHGFERPAEAFDGEDALRKIRQNPPDIVLTDILMPIMSGLELIGVVSKEFPQVLFVMLSNYDDFSYVKGALTTGAYDYVLKFELTAESLCALLENMKNELERRQSKQKMDVAMEHQRYAAYLQQLASGKREGQENTFPLPSGILLSAADNNEGKIALELLQRISGALQHPTGRVMFAGENKRHFLFLQYGKQEAEPDALYELMQEVHWGRKMWRDKQYIVVISNYIRGESRFADCCRNCRAMLDCVFYDSDIHILSERHFQPFRHETSLEEYLDYIPRIIRNLQINCISEAEAELHRLLQCMKERQLEPPQAFMVLEHLVHDVNRLCFAFNAQLPPEFTKGMIPGRHFQLCWDINEVAREFSRIVRAIGFLPYGGHLLVKNTTVLEAIRYIEQNFNGPISLQKVADHVMVNKNHLCRLLKTHAQVNFNSLLNSIRIQHAKRLLTNTSLSLQDVGFAVGFSDYRYFKKVFTHIAGKGPSEYRGQTESGEVI